MENKTLSPALRLFMGDQPSLDHDVWIDSCPDQKAADTMVRQYADMLVRYHLADRFGVYSKALPRDIGRRDVATDTFRHGRFGIYLGPHEAAHAAA